MAYLKRTLQQRTDQILELEARLEGLEQVHASDAKRYEATLANMEADFARAKEQLVSENMVLAKKLDALEEFRIQREQLMAKFEEQEERVESLKKEYEERQVESVHQKIVQVEFWCTCSTSTSFMQLHSNIFLVQLKRCLQDLRAREETHKRGGPAEEGHDGEAGERRLRVQEGVARADVGHHAEDDSRERGDAERGEIISNLILRQFTQPIVNFFI